MNSTSSHLIAIIEQALPLLQHLTEEQAAHKAAPDKWSIKEIIGHLIDSANNNVQKFVRTIAEDGVRFVGYEQDLWVSSQHYNEENWQQLLSVWANMNYHLAHIMLHIPEATLQHTIYIGDKGPYTLEFIVKDYNEHLKHHLLQVFPQEEFLSNYFKMVY